MHDANFNKVKDSLSASTDFKHREIKLENITVQLAFMEAMTEQTDLSAFVIEPLLRRLWGVKTPQELEEKIDLLSYCETEMLTEEKKAEEAVLRGKAVLFLGNGSACACDTRKVEKRSISPPEAEHAVNSSMDSFLEDLKVNISLIRKKIVSPKLRVISVKAGKKSNTTIDIVYMEGLTDPALVEETRRRVQKMNIDSLLSSYSVEEYLTEHPLCLIPQVLITERPDRFCTGLLNGQVGLLADGLPLGYLAPAVLGQLMSTPEDQSVSPVFATVVRFLRYTMLLIQLFLPGFFVAVLTFHYEMLPTELALSISQAKQGVPFPVVLEVLAMLAIFQVLIQAGLHMPGAFGQVVSIVGGLVVGQAAISAKLICPAAIIVVAVSAIASFAMPNQNFGNAMRMWRVIITIAGRVAGLFGVTAAGLLLLIRLASLENFGVPFLAPFAAVKDPTLIYSMVVTPEKSRKFRPEYLHPLDRRRAR